MGACPRNKSLTAPQHIRVATERSLNLADDASLGSGAVAADAVMLAERERVKGNPA